MAKKVIQVITYSLLTFRFFCIGKIPNYRIYNFIINLIYNINYSTLLHQDIKIQMYKVNKCISE